MAADNQSNEGKLTGITTRQKLVTVGIVVVLLIIIWQIIGMMSGNGAKPATQITPTAQKTGSTGGTPPTGQNIANATAAGQTQQLMETSQMMALQRDADVLKQQQEIQKNYLGALNELQVLKVQREIAEANQAIATAKLATVTAEKGVSELYTKPGLPQIPAGAYANAMVAPVQAGAQAVPPGAPGAPVAAPEIQYVVLSVSMELNHWNAVIGYQGKLYTVTIGDTLPADDSVVVSINRNGVTLEKDGKKRTISLVSSI